MLLLFHGVLPGRPAVVAPVTLVTPVTLRVAMTAAIVGSITVAVVHGLRFYFLNFPCFVLVLLGVAPGHGRLIARRAMHPAPRRLFPLVRFSASSKVVVVCAALNLTVCGLLAVVLLFIPLVTAGARPRRTWLYLRRRGRRPFPYFFRVLRFFIGAMAPLSFSVHTVVFACDAVLIDHSPVDEAHLSNPVKTMRDIVRCSVLHQETSELLLKLEHNLILVRVRLYAVDGIKASL